MKEYIINNNSVLYNGKCEEVIPILEDNSIDLCITSPPYNVDLGNNKFNMNSYDQYEDNKDYDDYINWLKDIFGKLYLKMKKGGRICINVGDPHNGKIPAHIDICHFMIHDLKYLPMANIIWDKNQTSNFSAWGSWCSPSSPSFTRMFEYIMIFAKETLKLEEKGETDLTPNEFKNWASSVWKIQPDTKMKKWGHPAVFPVSLPYRCIKMLTWKNALVLDPFNGVGSTAVASELLGRKYIGIELSENYCKTTIDRINNTRDEKEINIF